MLLNKNNTTKSVNVSKKPVKCYSFKDMFKSLPSEDYGANIQKHLESKGYVFVNDNGSVKSFTGVPGYAYVVLIEQAEIDYLICCETEQAYILWMRKFSMIPHLIQKFLPV